MGRERPGDKEDEMSLYDYDSSLDIASRDYSFFGLIMAAMRQADSINSKKLEREWPEVWEELRARYNAPGGFLEGEEGR